ncbi:hypothetical protein V6N12_010759 [Hibiscus sabdariffa]|uniref:RNase H type-1 domain-containing protein n=1 Tax=Hibiscus sabdariffa TaxID=183260 RepID=A0ABR2EL34_9ROSI
MVADMVQESGEWDWFRLHQLLPQECMDRIAAIHPPCSTLGEDIPQWRWEPNSQFSTRSAYSFLAHADVGRVNKVWKKVWQLRVPQWVRVFIWLSLHERLLTNAEQVLRHCAELDVSEICHGGCEDIDHVLRSCSAAKGVWEWVIPLGNRFEFFDLPFIDWLQRNLFATASASSDTDWSARFAIICWLLWKRRCALIFTLAVGVVDDILDRSNRVVAECRRAFDNRTISLPVSVPESRWRTPKTAWVKVNVDAAVSTLDSSAGVGVVCRDCNGRWMSGVARAVGRCTALVAELWAIHDGLLHAWSTGYRFIEMESDCLEAVKVVMSEFTNMQESALVWSIKKWLQRDWQVEVHHVGHGCNRAADRMAASGRGLLLMATTFPEAPDGVQEIVVDEMN